MDATTLSDPMQVNIFGIIQSDTKSFTANYNKTDYKKVKEAGYSTTTLMTVTNTMALASVTPRTDIDVKAGDAVLDIQH